MTTHKSKEQRFEEFLSQCPQVWELFVRFTNQLIAAGHTQYSADAVLHRIRWHVAVDTGGEGGFKLNDHFSAHFSRKFTREFPEHGQFFRQRLSSADFPTPAAP